MTTKELIAKLQQADPDGNAIVVIPDECCWFEPIKVESSLTPPKDCIVLGFIPKVIIKVKYHQR